MLTCRRKNQLTDSSSPHYNQSRVRSGCTHNAIQFRMLTSEYSTLINCARHYEPFTATKQMFNTWTNSCRSPNFAKYNWDYLQYNINDQMPFKSFNAQIWHFTFFARITFLYLFHPGDFLTQPNTQAPSEIRGGYIQTLTCREKITEQIQSRHISQNWCYSCVLMN